MVVNRQRRVAVNVGALNRFLQRARWELRFPRDGVAVQLISDADMKRLNWKFRRKRGTTDVLSFPASPQEGATDGSGRHAGGKGYRGDIAISPERARRNAEREQRTLAEELRILVLHGMIHLAGYDHETDQGEMQTLEMTLRRRLGLPVP